MYLRPIDATERSGTSEPNPDVELMARIQAGDSGAEAVLFERYGARLYYPALSRTSLPQDAEDVRSETLLRVLSAIRNRQLRSPAALTSFMLRTLDHVALEMFRQESHASRCLGPASQRGTTFPGRRRAGCRRLDPGASEASRARFPAYVLLRMYYYEELSKEEIASRIGIAEERVRLLKSRALQSFRKRFLRSRAKKTDTTGGGPSRL